MHDSRLSLTITVWVMIACFDTSEWSYNLECGSIKTTGGHTLDVKAQVLLKIPWPIQRILPFLQNSGSILFIVKMVLSLVPCLSSTW